MSTKPDGDIKIMLPREWEVPLYRAQADLREGSLSGVSRRIIGDYLRAKGFIAADEAGAGSEPETAAATAEAEATA